MKPIFRFYALLLIEVLLASFEAKAQFTASGVVKDPNGEALFGVAVAVKNTTLGTTTDINGNYSLSIPGDSARLVFVLVGFQRIEQTVTKSSPTADVTLKEGSTKLEEVVVSGLATTVKRSNLANSVDYISSKEIVGITTQQTVDGALYGKFKGANIVANSGAPGGGISIKLRGVTSITGQSQPLFVVDGVYIDNSSTPGGLNFISKAAAAGNPANQDNPSNRIADLNPEDIESIEILKGASAAAIYGSRAGAGVVVVTTKRGKPGKTQVNFSQSFGMCQMLRPLGVREWDAEKVEKKYGKSEVPKFEAAKAAGKLYNYEDELFGQKGFLSTTNLSVSGGTERSTFFASATAKHEDGIVKNTGYDKMNLRLNFDHKLNDFIDIALSNNYVTSSADRGFFNNDNTSTTLGVAFVSTPSWVDLHPDANGNYPDNPFATNFLQTRDLVTNNEKVNRINEGATITTKLFSSPTSVLKFIARGGLDHYILRTSAIFPRELQFQKNGNGTNGASIQGSLVNTNSNLEAFLVHTYFPANTKFSFRTQGGVMRLDFKQNLIRAYATQLIGSQTNLNQAGSLNADQFRTIQQDKGFFGQEEINYNDQVIAAFGVRGDKSSNNGDVNKLYYFPKASLAANVAKFSFWSFHKMSQLKLRVAYGQSGNFAPFGSAFTSLTNSTSIGGNVGLIPAALLGNKKIGPERQSEIEGGFDLGFFDNSLTLDVTFYKKSVKNLILNAAIPPSTGYVQKVLNPADLQNKGLEIGLNYELINKKNFSWSSRTTFWLNRSEITRLDIPAFNLGGFGATLGTFRIEKGKSATQIVGIGPKDKDTDGDGVVVWGNAEPDFQMSFLNTLEYHNFEFSFLFHWKKGGDNINLTTLLADLAGTSPDYDKKTLDPNGQLVNGEYRPSQLGTSAEVFIEDASYFRLREIGLAYRFPKPTLEKIFNNKLGGLKIGISAYNLLNFFKYNSYDPEVSNFVGGLSTGVEVTPFPSSKRMFVNLSANF